MGKKSDQITNVTVVYNVSDLVSDIRVLLDLNEVDTQLVAAGDGDTLSIDALIESKLVEAARAIMSIAPVHLLPTTSMASATITWETGRTSNIGGSIPLPAAFMRLVAFKMSDWERPVHQAIGVASPIYEQQHSRYGGIRGNKERPVVAIVPSNGALNLEFYSCATTSATIETALYCAYPYIDNSGTTATITLPSKLLPEIEQYAGGLVCRSLGDEQKAAALLQLGGGRAAASETEEETE